MGERVYLASSHEQTVTSIRSALTQNGFQVIGEAKDGMTVLRQIRTSAPDLVILDSSLQAMGGLKVAQIIQAEQLGLVIVLIDSHQQDLMATLSSQYNLAYLVKPINEQNLIVLANQMITSKKTISQLENELRDLKEKLQSRKVVERAKGLLMKQVNITEDEAFRRMRKQSMDRRISMEKVAEAIIMAFQV